MTSASPSPSGTAESNKASAVPKVDTETTTPIHDAAGTPAWGPEYLRRSVLVSFIIVFSSLTATLVVILIFSQRPKGLAYANENLAFLWTLGPTAVLTITIGFWSRVEFQAKRYLPWMIMAENKAEQSVQRALFQDYFSLWNVYAIYPAFRDRHFVVALPIIVGLLLRVQLLLSAGLMGLQEDHFLEPTDITIEDSFAFPAQKPTPHEVIGYGLEDLMLGITTFNFSQPVGTTGRLVHQNFRAKDKGFKGRIQATVDGLASNMVCRDAKLEQVANGLTTGSSRYNYTYYIQNPLCNGSTPLQPRVDGPNLPNDTVSDQYYYSVRPACTGDHFNIALTKWRVDPIKYSNGTAGRLLDLQLDDYAALGCHLTHTLSRFNVTKSESDVTIEARQIADQLSRNVTTLFPPPPEAENRSSLYDEFFGTLLQKGIDRTSARLKDVHRSALGINWIPGLGPFSNDTWSKYLEKGALQNATEDYFMRYSGLVVWIADTTPNTTTATGVAFVTHPSLRASGKISIAMIAIFSAIVLATIALLFYSPTQVQPLRRVDTVLDYAILFRRYESIVRRFRGTGLAPLSQLSKETEGKSDALSSRAQNTIRTLNPAEAVTASVGEQHKLTSNHVERVTEGKQKWYGNWSTLPLTQISAVIAIVGIIAVIGSLFSRSKANNGLDYVSDDPKMRLLWTTLPVALMTGVSLYCDSFYFTIRDLYPFWNLRRQEILGDQSPDKHSVNRILNHLDETVVTTLVRSLHNGHLTVFLAAIIYLLSTFLGIATSYLFTTIDIEEVGSIIPLQQQTWFAPSSSVSMSNDVIDAIGYIMFPYNLTNLPGTYEGLVFPEFTLRSDVPPWPENVLRIRARIPALRSQLTCTAWSSGSANRPANGTLDAALQAVLKTTCVRVPEFADPASRRYFGTTITVGDIRGLNDASCAWPWDFVFWWGQGTRSYLNITTPFPGIRQYDALLMCTEGWSTVETDIVFHSAAPLRLDDSAPPRIDEATAKPYPYMPPTNRQRLDKPGCSSTNIFGDTWRLFYDFDCFFHRLVNIRFMVQDSDLDSDAGRDRVAAAVKDLHGSLRAQAVHLGSGFRRAAFSSGQVEGATPPSQPPAGTAEVLQRRGRRRLVQNAGATRALLGILAAMLVLYVAVGWRTGWGRAVVPKNPMSVAAMASLLADSNLFRMLPEEAERMRGGQLEKWFEGREFRMGWFAVREADGAGGAETRFTIGVVDGSFRGVQELPEERIGIGFRYM